MGKYVKTLILISIFIFPIYGCSGGDEKKDKPSSNPAEAVMDYIQGTINKKDESRNQLGLTRARQKIRNFWSSQGRYPKDLSELERATGPLPKPGPGFQYQYDAATHQVTVVRKR